MKTLFGIFAGYFSVLICHIIINTILNKQNNIADLLISSAIPILCVFLLLWNKANENKHIKKYIGFLLMYIITFILMLTKFHQFNLGRNTFICLLLATIPILAVGFAIRFWNHK